MALTQYYYSPSTKGIYSAEVHGSYPTDRVAITLAQYAQVAAGTHSVTVSGTTATTVQITPQAAVGTDPKVIVDSVGIGNKFGSITIADQETPSAVTARFLFGNTTAGYGALRLITNSTKNVTIDAVDWATSATQKHMCLQPNGGNIGIGTATPSAKLYVVGESYVDYANEAGITGGALRFASSSNASSVSNNEYYDGANRFTRTGGSGKIRIWQTNDAMGGAIDFLSGKTGPANTPITYTSTMMLTSDGNVGIGTATPSAKLYVVGESYVDYSNEAGITGGRLRFATNTTYGILSCNEYFDGTANRFSRTGGIGKIRMVHTDNAAGASAGSIEFLTGGTGNAGAISIGRVTMAMRPDGNVGIGTIAPSAILEISGTPVYQTATNWGSSTTHTSVPHLLLRSDIGNTIPEIQFMEKINKSWVLGGNGTGTGNGANGTFCIRDDFQSGNPVRLAITNTGNVGIGTTTPQGKLEVWNGATYLNNGRIDGNYGDQIFFGAAPSAYGTTYLHKIKTSHSSTLANSLMTFSLDNGASTFADVLTLAGSGLVSVPGTLTTNTANVDTLNINATGTGIYLPASGNAQQIRFNDGGTPTLPNSLQSPSVAALPYSIYREGGTWTSPYPDLVISYHTGIKLIAYNGYGGTRFYSLFSAGYQTDANILLSVGNGDDHVRVGSPTNTTSDLIVYGNVTATKAPTVGEHLCNKTYVDTISFISNSATVIPIGGIVLIGNVNQSGAGFPNGAGGTIPNPVKIGPGYLLYAITYATNSGNNVMNSRYWIGVWTQAQINADTPGGVAGVPVVIYGTFICRGVSERTGVNLISHLWQRIA